MQMYNSTELDFIFSCHLTMQPMCMKYLSYDTMHFLLVVRYVFFMFSLSQKKNLFNKQIIWICVRINRRSTREKTQFMFLLYKSNRCTYARPTKQKAKRFFCLVNLFCPLKRYLNERNGFFNIKIHKMGIEYRQCNVF